MTRVVNCTNAPFDVYIGRPSMWGNPFTEGSRTEIINQYRNWILNSPESKHVRNKLHTLNGKTLGCWCKPKACHGDVIVEILNNNILDVFK